MTFCVLCESEAELAIDGAPLCKKCYSRPNGETGKLKADQQIRAALNLEVQASTARAHSAAAALSAIMGDIPSGLPHPDGSLRIKNAAHALAAARNEVMRAHSRLDDFLARHVVPGNFDPGDSA